MSQVFEVFSKEYAEKQLLAFHDSGFEQASHYWNFGYEQLTQAVPTLREGLFHIFAPENVGKSQAVLNIGYGALTNDEDVYWLDFSLDDGEEDRLSYLMARAGKITINLAKQAAEATPEEKQQRHEAIKEFYQTYGERYRLFSDSSRSDDDEDEPEGFQYTIEWITRIVGWARDEIGPEKKLLVTIDSFHDVGLQARHADEMDRLSQLSVAFKKSSKQSDCLYLFSTQTRKDSRKRNVTPDALLGCARILFDARVMVYAYSDVNLNQNKASVFWVDQDKPTELQPVLELHFKKNKAGSFKGVALLEHERDTATLREPDAGTRAYYQQCLYASDKKKKAKE